MFAFQNAVSLGVDVLEMDIHITKEGELVLMHDETVDRTTDGTGEMAVLWMGRRSIPGLSLGTRVVVVGMVGEERGLRRMVNPRFEFST